MDMNSSKRPVVYATRDFPPGCGTPNNVHDEAVKRSRTCDVVVENHLSHERPVVCATRDFPSGCGTPNNVPDDASKRSRTSDVVVENHSSQKQLVVYETRDFPPCCGTSSNVPDDASKISRTSDVVVENHPSQKQPVVYATRDFLPGCGTSSNVPDDASKRSRTSDVVVENHPSQKQPVVYATRDFLHVCGSSSNVPDDAFKRSRTCDIVVQNPSVGHDVADSEPVGEEQEFRNTHQDHVHTPREKVQEVLRVFKEMFKKLDQDKQARRGGDLYEATARIDLRTQAFLESQGKHVNQEHRIGQVPGIQVGDEFQYKAELRLVGIHFRLMGGIDYVKIGGVKFATSIVSSRRYDYNDKFDTDVVIYTGEGGNMMDKEKKAEDQKMIKGNLALANSMRHKREVRVIRGSERWDGKGMHYVYDGLYLVDMYWLEKGVSGKSVYKFKLCKITGQ